jgi:peptidoglycan/xylan/chitin deacetylase (PgdA/CDA1 family)
MRSVLLAATLFINSAIGAVFPKNMIPTMDGCGGTNNYVLTFDDGPEVSAGQTVQILGSLKKLGIKATFFMSPAQAGEETLVKQCAIARQVALDGHDIQSHSWSHPDFAFMTNADIKTQLDKTSDWIFQCAGKRPTMFRPPFGSLTAKQAKYITQELGYIIAFWNMDSNDWTVPNDPTLIMSNTDVVFQTYKTDTGAMPTNVVMLHHDRSSATNPDVLEMIYNKYKSQYRFLTMSQCWDYCQGHLDQWGMCRDTKKPHYQIQAWNTADFGFSPSYVNSPVSSTEPPFGSTEKPTDNLDISGASGVQVLLHILAVILLVAINN